MSKVAALRAMREENIGKIERDFRSRATTFTPDLSRMPSGECDGNVAAWVACAFQELERLREEVALLKACAAQSNDHLTQANKSNTPSFDKRAYQREYMRKRRAKDHGTP